MGNTEKEGHSRHVLDAKEEEEAHYRCWFTGGWPGGSDRASRKGS